VKSKIFHIFNFMNFILF